MSFREFGETAVMYLTRCACKPLQRSNKGLKSGGQISPQITPDTIRTISRKGINCGEPYPPPHQARYNSPRQFLKRKQCHSPDPTFRKEIAMAKANYVTGRHEDLINGVEEPFHIPASIQSHGAAIVTKEPEL